MKTNRSLILMILVLICGCGVPVPSFEPLEDRLLKVVEVLPSSGEEIGPDGKVVLKFSAQLDPLSISQKTVFVANTEDLPDDMADIDDAELNPVPGTYLVSESGDEVHYKAEGDFRNSGEYTIIVTNEVFSLDGLPFSSGKSNEPFASNFFVNVGGISGDGPASGDLSDNSSDDGSGTSDDPGSGDEGGEEEPPPLPPGPTHLLINEVMYDADGSDTNGEVFIELVGEVGGYLEGYYINLINGDDGKTYKTIPITEGYYVPDDGIFVIADVDSSGNSQVEEADFLVNFDPQNGPDSVQLINRDNELLDCVGYGNIPTANAQNGLVTYEGTPAEDVSGGVSLSRLADAEDTNDNSVDFIVNNTPSPGSNNIIVSE